jgi:DegV family protein with EDD domain
MIKITADSTADLEHLFIEKDIPVMPLYITLGGVDYRDGVDITPQIIFETYEAKKILPKSAAVGQEEYKEFFVKHKPEGGQIIHFCISAELSMSYENAKKAGEEVGGVFVVDSRTLSSGIGLLVLKAQELAKSGMSAKDIFEKINDLAQHPQTSFVVYSMEFLHKGGRCSGLQRIFAAILRIKPVLQLVGGKITVGRKYMGSYEKNITRYVEETLNQFNTPDYSRIFITHSGAEQHIVDKVKEQIKQIAPQFKEIIVTHAGSTVTTHCGKGTLGILYINKN